MELLEQKLIIDYKYGKQSLSYFYRPGSAGVILWLHAFCCSKEDFRPAFSNELLNDYSLAAFDFPGSPNSPYPASQSYDLDDLVEITKKFVEQLKLDNLVVIGHSAGSLVASLLAERNPSVIKAIVSVEGNMDLSDCWLTAKIAGNSYRKFIEEILPEYLKTLEGTPIEVYGGHLRRADPRSCYDYAGSVVRYSKQALENFLNLPLPKLFIYCSENSALPYLPVLKQSCQVVEVPNSNHWPTYDNPNDFFKVLFSFVNNLSP